MVTSKVLLATILRRNDRSFEILQSYIQDNPLRWKKDRLHPDIRTACCLR